MNAITQNSELISSLIPVVLLIVTIVGLIVGRFVYGISLLQPLEKIAHEQQEYRRKAKQESLKRAITQRHLLLGNNLLYVGDFSTAQSEFNAALAIDPINEDASMGLFKAEINSSIARLTYTTEIVVKKIDLIFQYRKDDAFGFYLMGMVYKDMEHKLAIEYFEKAIKSDPLFPDAYYRLGMVYEVADELDTMVALKHYEKALQLSSLNQNYLNNLGYQYFQNAQYDKAIEHYRTLIRLDKYDMLPYLTLSTSLLLQGNPDHSSAYLFDFLDIVTRKPDVMTMKFNSLNWYFESFSKRKVLLDTPDKKLMYANLAMYYRLFAANLGFKAEPYFKAAIELYIKNPADNRCVVDLVKFELINYVTLRGQKVPDEVEVRITGITNS